jgi:hypothetical protein
VTINIVCSECKCSINNCNNNEFLNNNIKCRNCIKEICCCIKIHTYKVRKQTLFISSNLSLKTKSKLYFSITKNLLPTALGIEILCIMAAEIGENIGLYTFGFNLTGIALAYAIGYALAGFTTFMTILGRYTGLKIESCCSVLEQQSNKGFLSNMFLTFEHFIKGIQIILYLKKEPNLKYILKTSMVILITAESACILTAETIGIVLYNYSILLGIPLALLGGALTVVFIEAHKKVNIKSKNCNSGDCADED